MRVTETSPDTTSPDTTLNAITDAVALGHAGDTDVARARLLALWRDIGPAGDPLHRCTLAHYLADLYADPAQALAWDVRALDAADTVTDARAGRHHPGLRVAGFYPSLHLNLADGYRRLGSFTAAGEHIEAARQHVHELGDDAYGSMIRGAIEEVAGEIARCSTRQRPSAP